MPVLTAAQLLLIARQHLQAGQAEDAQALCRKVLAREPRNPAALHLSALAAERAGRRDAAASLLARAAVAAPQNPDLHAELGRVEHLLNHLPQAQAAYACAREIAPHHFPAAVGLARVLHAQRQFASAAEAWRSALAINPGAVELYIPLSDTLLAQGDAAAAAQACQQALAARPADPALQHRLAVALAQAGELEDALAAARRAVDLDSASAAGWDHLGQILHQLGRLEPAAAAFQEATARDPAWAPAFIHLGHVYLALGATDQAVSAYHQALVLSPEDPEVFARIGEALKDEAQWDAVIAAYRDVIARRPADPQAYFDVGLAFQRRRQLDAAMDAYRRVLELDPDHVPARNNLALALKDAGRIPESITCLRHIIAAHPDDAACHGNLLYVLHFAPASDAGTLDAEHVRWRQAHADRFKAIHRPHPNSPDPQRPLRIGYVSPNFREHPVGRFMAPVLAAHDRTHFQTTCYAHLPRADELTQIIQKSVDHWVDVRHLSPEALALRIRDDQIDILVDLTMHMGDSRLLTFARKPAPIQVTYLAYCSTTGLDSIDYRLTDPYLDPPEEIQNSKFPASSYAEQPYHLPVSYWCYAPGFVTPEVNPLPALAAGHVTFASLNNFCKVSPACLDLWRRLLSQVPDSHLVMHALPGQHRQEVLDFLAAAGIGSQRVRFFDMLTLDHYFRLHHAIDIALDPFPYPGGTTTCDALWMGVPTISLVGQAPHTRSGLSILSNIGLSQFAVTTPEDYLRAAGDLAADLSRLADLRATLRQRLLASPLMDAPRFTRDLEAAYRTMWQHWCARRTR